MMAPKFMMSARAVQVLVLALFLLLPMPSLSFTTTSNNNINHGRSLLLLLSSSSQSTTGTSTTTTKIRIDELLSTCIDACMRGCEAIRRVQSKREKSGGDGSNDKLLHVDLKDVDDPKSALTEADKAAQYAVITSLKNTWGPDLHVVGEEDDDDMNDGGPSSSDKYKDGSLRKDLLSQEVGNSPDTDDNDDYDYEEVLLSDLTIYVDPLDGTREFVEGRISNCQTLVGVCYKGETAIAGAMGMPCPAGDLSQPPSIVYALNFPSTNGNNNKSSKVGVYGNSNTYRTDKKRQEEYEDYPLLLATGDAVAPVMVGVRETLSRTKDAKNILYGGAGNKIMGTALNEIDCTAQHKYGGPWDVCAPEALIRACGGRITDLFGQPLSNIYNNPRCSNFGYVATSPKSRISHDELCQIISECSEVQEYKDKVTASTSTN